MDMEPAKTIIEYLGGAKSAAEIVRKHPSRIYRWAYPSTKREGCDGIIPLKDQRVILEFCQGVGVDLRREDFFSSDRLRSILQSNKSNSPASSSAGDDAGVPVTPPAHGAPETNFNSPDHLPSGEAGAQRSPAVCAPATFTKGVAR